MKAQSLREADQLGLLGLGVSLGGLTLYKYEHKLSLSNLGGGDGAGSL